MKHKSFCQFHAAHVLLDKSVKHKRPQLHYLNRLRPSIPPKQNDASTEPPPAPRPETPALSIISQKQDDENRPPKLMTKDEGNELQQNRELNETIKDQHILAPLELLIEHKLKRAKKVFEIIKQTTRVIINKDDLIFIDKMITGLKCSTFLDNTQ